MTDKEALQEFEDNAYHESMKPKISEAAKACAISALRERMERRNGCGFCNSDRHFLERTGVDRDGVFLGSCRDESERFKFCPMCGRKLSQSGKEN